MEHNQGRVRKSGFQVLIGRLIAFFIVFAVFGTVTGILFSMKLHAGLPLSGMMSSVPPSGVVTDTVSAVESEVDYNDTLLPEKEYTYDFTADLSAYEQYMNPENRDDYLLLVNYAHTLDESYKPDDLTDIPTREGREVQTMRFTAAQALIALLTEAKAEGITDVTVTSGWRSYNTQVYLLQSQVAKYTSSMSEEEAYALAITEVAIPGTSEHQSGLCVDMHNLSYADTSFAQTESAKWLADNCYKFGFVLRYPEDKIDVTKISFEPWHFRYVGRYHASRMHTLGMCLEEYLAYMGLV